MATVLLLLVDAATVWRRLTDLESVTRALTATQTASEVLDELLRKTTACAAGGVVVEGETDRALAERSLEYDSHYHLPIDRTVATRTFYPEPSGTGLHPELKALSNCVAASLPLTEWDNGRRTGGEVLWVFVRLQYERQPEEPQRGAFVSWPAADIGSFDPRERPWDPSQVRTKNKGCVDDVADGSSKSDTPRSRVEGGKTCLSVLYHDAFTTEPIGTLTRAIRFPSGIEAVGGVDLRVEAVAKQRPFVAFTGFWLVVACCLVNGLMAKSFDHRAIRQWYRAWLCIALASCITVWRTLVSVEPVLQLGAWAEMYVAPLLSSLNNGFFLLAALYLGDIATQSATALRRTVTAETDGARRLWVFAGTFVVIVTVTLLLSTGHEEIATWPETLFTIFMLIVMTRSFLRVAIRMPVEQVKTRRQRLTLTYVLSFMAVVVAAQAIVPFLHKLVLADAAFLVVNVLTRTVWFGLFYGLFILQEYRLGWEFNDFAMYVLVDGVIAVDEDLRVIKGNRAAGRVLGRIPRELEGRLLHEVLFGSLFQAEDVHERLRRREEVGKMVVRGKRGDILLSARPVESEEVSGQRVFAMVSVSETSRGPTAEDDRIALER